MKAALVKGAALSRAASACLAAAATVLLAVRLAAAEPPAPGTRLELGFEERIRTENIDDATDFDHAVVDARHQWRFRTRLWARLDVGTGTSLFVGLNNESRKLITPETPMTLDEIVFETLYLDQRLADGVSVRLGRQDLRKGDGFLVMEGGPLDGSRTFYYNALDLAFTRPKGRLDLLLISDPKQDQYLPVIHDKHRPLIEWDEFAVGLYASDTTLARTTLDGYWFFKTETDDTRPTSNPARQGDRRFHTAGARATHDLAGDWALMLELAGQFGEQDPETEVRAWGGQASVRKAFPGAPAKPSVTVGYVGLSGDDPGTAAHEGWDPLFSRWPKWSDMYIYTLVPERGAAYWTNLSMGIAELRLTPAKPLRVWLAYQRMGAFHRYPGKPAMFADGMQRGEMVLGRADIRVNDRWRGHVMGEWMTPGSFYTGDDASWFFRAEVIYTFRYTFGS